MSQPTTLSQSPEPLTAAPSRPPPHRVESPAEIVRRLRAEVDATADGARRARLLDAIGDLHERDGDEPGATRDYLAAHAADPAFLEPLEGLARLLEKRRSLRNLGRIVDPMIAAAGGDDERARALLLKAAYEADVAGRVPDALETARAAAAIEDASPVERAGAWLAVEILAGRAGDAAARDAALAERARYAGDATWRGLLLVDRARALAARGEVDAAAALLDEVRAGESGAAWIAAAQLEDLLRDAPGAPADGDAGAQARAERRAAALDAIAELCHHAAADAAQGDALGVPLWAREPARVVDAWLRAADARRLLGRFDLAEERLDRALDPGIAGRLGDDDRRLAAGLVAGRRLAVAEQAGDAARAAQLARQLLADEGDPQRRAALAVRVAWRAIDEGDRPAALDALARAVEADAGCVPARALQLDLLAGGDDPAAFAGQIEASAEHLATDEARGSAFLLAAYVWAALAKDTAGAKAALSQAAMLGVPQATIGRAARALASVSGDAGWYEDATRRLLAAGGHDDEVVSLSVELLRLRRARGDADGAAKALRELSAAARGAWIGRVLEGFLPGAAAPDRARAAVDELAAAEVDAELARGLGLIAAMRAHAAGDADAARRALRALGDRDPADALVAAYLGDLDRAAGDHAAAARVASDAAAATADGERAAALRLEAAFERWRDGDRIAAIEEMEAAVEGAPAAARLALAWASWGVDPDSAEARRRALERAAQGGPAGDARRIALERFALEVGGGDPGAARAALAEIERSPEGALGTAAALGRVLWARGDGDGVAVAAALERVEASGPAGGLIAAVERFRRAREAGDGAAAAGLARAWVDAGGGLPAAIEWLGAAVAGGQPREELGAREAIAAALPDEGRDAMLASAALVAARLRPDAPAPLVGGPSAAARLANLELSPPGCDPRRRATALLEAGGLLGDAAAVDAAALAGWAFLAASSVTEARAAFERAASARPGDLAAWEGLRACAAADGDAALHLRAASELGARCRDARRGAAFWEEAAGIGLAIGDEAAADRALSACFARDPTRAAAFDKLFRRVRARKDNAALLGLVQRRLAYAEDSAEILKLYWEQARVLRETGDQDGALESLEHVTMLDPDHVGALALLGEINIRRSNFDDAAASLARLASLEAAPAKNRLTAGIAAVDLYENKLNRPDQALAVLVALHKAGLSNLPVRERLARAAARAGAWGEATAILEELMNERPEREGRVEAARLAMAIHRDRLGAPQGARAAIVKLLEESPGDGEAIDMLLQTAHAGEARARLLAAARDALRGALAGQPAEVTTVRRLVRVARALEDEPLQQATLGALACLGSADSQADSTFAQLAAKNARAPQVAVSEAAMRAILAPGDAGPIADLFVLLGPTLAEALGPSLSACGVGRRDRVDPRSGIALRNEIAAWAGALGIRELDLYVGGNDPQGIQGVPGETMSLVVGAGVNAPLAPAARSRVARELFAMVRGTTVARSRDDVTVAAIVVAACKLAEVPVDHPPYAVLADVQRLIGKEISRKTRKALPEACRAIVAARADARAWSLRALASHDRVAVLASGDPGVVLSDALGIPLDALGKAVRGSPRAQDLLRFVLSAQYLELRRSLGLEAAP